MERRIDPDIERILPLLPLKDAAGLTPRRAREELVALADSRKDVPLPQTAAVTDIVIAAGPIAGRVYRPAKMPVATVIYFHGGGWVAGDLYTHDRQARILSIELEAVVVSVDYRRPPECQFPGPFEDCLTATKWVANNIADLGGDAARIGVAGDSAGGNLAAAVALACADGCADGWPRLAGQFLVYPAVDLVGRYQSEIENAKYPSRSKNAEGYFLTTAAMRFFASQYIPDEKDAANPRASPLRATDLKGVARAVVCTAEFDPLRDEGEAYANALKHAGVRVTYFGEPGMIHGYFAMGAASPAADKARLRACREFKACLE
jgi:acetyl esterase